MAQAGSQRDGAGNGTVVDTDPPSSEAPATGAPARSEPWLLYAIFFISGWAALVYQVLFSKQLTYVFGSMSTATNTVLATYMGGMALGTWLVPLGQSFLKSVRA